MTLVNTGDDRNTGHLGLVLAALSLAVAIYEWGMRRRETQRSCGGMAPRSHAYHLFHRGLSCGGVLMTYVFSAEVRNNTRGYQAVVLPTNRANFPEEGLVGNLTVANRGASDAVIYFTATRPPIPEGRLTAAEYAEAVKVLEGLKVASVPANEALLGGTWDWFPFDDILWCTVLTRSSLDRGLDLYIQLYEQGAVS